MALNNFETPNEKQDAAKKTLSNLEKLADRANAGLDKMARASEAQSDKAGARSANKLNDKQFKAKGGINFDSDGFKEAGARKTGSSNNNSGFGVNQTLGKYKKTKTDKTAAAESAADIAKSSVEESDFSKGKAQVTKIGRIAGLSLGVSSIGATAARASLNREMREHKVKDTGYFGNGYMQGNDALSGRRAYQNNLGMMNSYFKNRGINTERLSNAEIKQALEKGYMKKGTDRIALTGEDRAKLKELQFLNYQKHNYNAAVSTNKGALVKQWLRTATEDSDAYKGFTTAKTTVKGAKVAAKATGAGIGLVGSAGIRAYSGLKKAGLKQAGKSAKKKAQNATSAAEKAHWMSESQRYFADASKVKLKGMDKASKFRQATRSPAKYVVGRARSGIAKTRVGKKLLPFKNAIDRIYGKTKGVLAFVLKPITAPFRVVNTFKMALRKARNIILIVSLGFLLLLMCINILALSLISSITSFTQDLDHNYGVVELEGGGVIYNTSTQRLVNYFDMIQASYEYNMTNADKNATITFENATYNLVNDFGIPDSWQFTTVLSSFEEGNGLYKKESVAINTLEGITEDIEAEAADATDTKHFKSRGVWSSIGTNLSFGSTTDASLYTVYDSSGNIGGYSLNYYWGEEILQLHANVATYTGTVTQNGVTTKNFDNATMTIKGLTAGLEGDLGTYTSSEVDSSFTVYADKTKAYDTYNALKTKQNDGINIKYNYSGSLYSYDYTKYTFSGYHIRPTAGQTTLQADYRLYTQETFYRAFVIMMVQASGQSFDEDETTREGNLAFFKTYLTSIFNKIMENDENNVYLTGKYSIDNNEEVTFKYEDTNGAITEVTAPGVNFELTLWIRLARTGLADMIHFDEEIHGTGEDANAYMHEIGGSTTFYNITDETSEVYHRWDGWHWPDSVEVINGLKEEGTYYTPNAETNPEIFSEYGDGAPRDAPRTEMNQWAIEMFDWDAKTFSEIYNQLVLPSGEGSMDDDDLENLLDYLQEEKGTATTVEEVIKENGGQTNSSADNSVNGVEFSASPVSSYTRVSSEFGWRIHPVYGYKKFHKGIDLAASAGTPVYAAADGIVTVAKTSGYNNGAGLYVTITHGDGSVVTKYMHLSGVEVTRGTYVKAGDLIGYVGSTGASTGNHLHFQIEVDGTPVDPRNYYDF